MPIRPPALDDRSYNDLVAELVARIPAHAPEWTNPAPGDPGRTLIELFSWLGDALLYRANLIPERQRLAFLRLLGQPLKPARPARGLVTLALKEKEIGPVQLDHRATLTGPVNFESLSEITVLPLTGQFYFKRPVAVETLEPGLEEALASFHNASDGINPYITTPIFAGGTPETDGFDVITETLDRALWLALLAPKAQAPLTQPDANKNALKGLTKDGAGLILNVGFVPALPDVDPLAPVSARTSIPHVWEITAKTSAEEVSASHPWQPEYLAMDRIADSTGGLIRPGVVRLRFPNPDLIYGPTNDLQVDPDAGVGDRPPRLDDLAAAARLVAWIRMRRNPAVPDSPAPVFVQQPDAQMVLTGSLTQPAAVVSSGELAHLRLSWLGFNALEIEQLTTRSNQIFAQSDGTADQGFMLPATSVEPATFNLQVESVSGWENWTRIEDLSALDWDAAASRDARVFQLDPEAGTVLFGDAVRGRIPGAGMRIAFTQMQAGGGRAGNLPPGTLKKIGPPAQNGRATASDKIVVFQPLELTGGEDAEELAMAEKRIPTFIRNRDRAVTADDYKVLAGQTPGVNVGRTEMLPLFKPQQRLFNVPGVVSVMVLPQADLGEPPNPRADRPFLEAVHAWLEPRRPLATELYVIGCEYVPVSVSVGIAVREESQPDETFQQIKDELRKLLWPLTGGGFDAQGWPLGRRLTNRELMVEVARVAGVDEVAGLNLFQRLNGVWQQVPEDGTHHEQILLLSPWQLPELLNVTAVIGDSAPNKLELPAVVPVNAIAVPVVPPLC
jgi:hypothetical protein